MDYFLENVRNELEKSRRRDKRKWLVLQEFGRLGSMVEEGYVIGEGKKSLSLFGHLGWKFMEGFVKSHRLLKGNVRCHVLRSILKEKS